MAASTNKLDFTLHKLESGVPGPTLLVIGGIQGDEPGGFTAASLLVTDYKITRGSVWVVPNLNFESIIKRSRGVYGDMNRKFLRLAKADPEYEAVQKIKSIILDKRVDLILNLHDGSGFYNPTQVNRQHNPHRWGQSVIIDQETISAGQYGDLQKLAAKTCQAINQNVKNNQYRFHVKNTETRKGNVEMEKTLTYFAIRHDKPAFGIEASKNFLTHARAYYHLLAVEGMMRELGVSFERGFKLTKADIKHRIDNNVKLAMFDNKIYLDMAGARKRLNYIPMKKDSQIWYSASNPLIAIIENKSSYKVRYGNRSVTQLNPQYFEYDDSLDSLKLMVDGELQSVQLGSVVNVKDQFMIEPIDNYRFNAIGFSPRGVDNESGLVIKRKDFHGRYSVDRASRKFRVEVYQGKKYCGMVLVHFIDDDAVDLALKEKQD